MTLLAVEPEDALGQLDRLALADSLPAREAARCAQLAELLRRPARSCVLGQDKTCMGAMVAALLADMPEQVPANLPNALEIQFGATPVTHVTLQDGTSMRHDGWPNAALLSAAPIFMQMEVPSPVLQGKSFVLLTLNANPDTYRQALSWAARRAEIAVWCTRDFDASDAEIWAHVPEHLSHHAYLARSGGAAAAVEPTLEFTETVELPMDGAGEGLDIRPLLNRLAADIDDARVADLDAAQMLLYRLRRFQADASPPAESDGAAPQGAPPGPEPSEALLRQRRILSEPLLFVQRRCRAMAEDMIWATAGGQDDWPQQILDGCVETAEALRDRTLNWPDDSPEISALSAMVEDVCDTLMLLQMEGGATRAGDAAALLWQIRTDLDQALFPRGEAA